MTDYHRPHVLIVSDDQGLSHFLRDGLVIAGFFTSVVASSIQTLEVFRLRTFDLMIVDAQLEGLAAAELVRRLRSLDNAEGRPRTDIPIVAIAGSEGERQVWDVSGVSVDRFYLPPIEIDELALDLFALIRAWRTEHPDRPWADQLAQRKVGDRLTEINN